MKLKIVIDKNGEIRSEVIDGQGDSCLRFSKELEELLGDVESREFKSEYYQESYSGKIEAHE